MAISLSLLLEPVGSIKPWLRPNVLTPVPTNWLICDGSIVADPLSPFNGLPLPDMRGRFLRGQDTLDNANFGADITYFPGGAGVQAGGVDSNNLAHSHTEGAHTHTFSIASSGTHSHSVSSFAGGSTSGGVDQVNGSTGVRFVYAGVAGRHDHTFTVPAHSTTVGGAHTHSGTTAGATGPGTGSALGPIDNKPVFRGLVFIIKVR